MIPRKNALFFSAVFLVLSACSGCATARHAVPCELATKAGIADMDEVRIVGGASHTLLQESLLESVKEERPGDFPPGPDGVKTYPVLAISGGGANGAYGAGLLKGWSESGTRPVFKVVTGVSTGAIIAPLAFLGKDHDGELEEYYTTMSTKDVASQRWPLAVMFGNSLADNTPLARKIAKIADDALLAKIAGEHRRGRRLYVGTTDLDAERFVIWDMGAIACRKDKNLFRKVILSSAAIPMIFPPSIFKVTVDGKQYDELHVDGGALTQVFATYKLLDGMKDAANKLGVDPSKVKSRLYIIRNGYMSPQYKKVDNALASIAEKSFNTMIDAQGLGDAYRLYTFLNQRGGDYNLAFIPPDFKDESMEMFDRKAMKKLFDRGYRDAAGGYNWHKVPPGMEPAQPAAK